MSGRQDKKLRQLYRRDFAHRMNDTLEDIQNQMTKIHRPAPRFFPKRLWRGLGRIFLNI